MYLFASVAQNLCWIIFVGQQLILYWEWSFSGPLIWLNDIWYLGKLCFVFSGLDHGAWWHVLCGGGSPVMREKVAEKLFRQSCLACSSHLNLHCRPVSWPGLLIGSSVQSKKQCSALLTVCLAGTWKSIYRWPEGHSKQHPCGVNCFWPWHSTDVVWELLQPVCRCGSHK